MARPTGDLLLVGRLRRRGTLATIGCFAAAGTLCHRPSPAACGNWHDESICAALWGHDSGITHLAAAVGLPCIGPVGGHAGRGLRRKCEPLVVLKEITGVRTISVEKSDETNCASWFGNDGHGLLLPLFGVPPLGGLPLLFRRTERYPNRLVHYGSFRSVFVLIHRHDVKREKLNVAYLNPTPTRCPIRLLRLG